MKSPILQKAGTYVFSLLREKLPATYIYHNYNHTVEVVAASEEIADGCDLTKDEKEMVLLAAWFHDAGFSSGEAHGHEDVSIHLATTFLQEHKSDPVLIQKVVSGIEATKIPQAPKNLIDQILCDADLFHLGTEEFTEKNKLLRDELIGFSKQDISKKQWRKMNISFLQNHKYFTDYCRRKLQPVKEKNLEELLGHNEGKKKKKVKEADTMLATFTEQLKKDTDTRKGEKTERTEREASTVFRIMASNQSNLSKMADDKAFTRITNFVFASP